MNSFQAPFVNSQTTPDQTMVEPSTQDSQGGGDSIPGSSGGPAETIGESVQTSTQMASSLFIDSPVEVVGARSGFAARTEHDTPDDPADLVLFQRLTRAGDFSEALRLCIDRRLTARCDSQAFRWNKDAGIVLRMMGQPEASLALVAEVHTRVERVGGIPFGKHLHGLARSFEMLRRYDDALIYYAASDDFLTKAGDVKSAAAVLTNTGRCLTAFNRPEDSHNCFDRAQLIAESYSDTLLCGEIDESRALAFEAQGLFRQARKMAAHSIYLLEGTTFASALAESRATYERLLGESAQRGRL